MSSVSLKEQAKMSQRDDTAQPAEDGAGSEVEVENAQWLAQLPL